MIFTIKIFVLEPVGIEYAKFDEHGKRHQRYHVVHVVNEQDALNDGNGDDEGQNSLAQEEKVVANVRHPRDVPVGVRFAHPRHEDAKHEKKRLNEAEGAHHSTLYRQVFAALPNQ